jgi:hypothetical protein
VLSGRLWLTDLFSCELSLVDMGALSVTRPGVETGCGVWPDPRGDLAILPHASPNDGEAGRPVSVTRLGARTGDEALLGPARGDVVWSRDGARLAYCLSPGLTVVQEPDGGSRLELPGCDPRFGADGSLLTRTYGQGIGDLLRDGTVLVSNDALSGSLGFAAGSTLVLGYDEREDGLLAIAASGLVLGRRSTLLSLWRDGRPVGEVDLPTPPVDAMSFFGEAVRFSPEGGKITVAYRGVGLQLSLIDVEHGLELTLPIVTGEYVWGYAWAPDGAWLAVSTGKEIRIVAATGGDASYVLALRAVPRAWTA